MRERVPRRKVSPFDPRSPAALAKGGMIGGDRMTDHGYAADYAESMQELLGGDMPGLTADWLRATELKYGGGRTGGIKWPKVSPLDPRPPEVVARGGHDGHRMQPREERGRNYAPAYAKALQARAGQRLTLVELGILRGIGLAIWCDLFPEARIIGLDVDTSHFQEHEGELRSRGAFLANRPEVYEFDELAPDAGTVIAGILKGDAIDIMIDDALHDTPSILTAMRAFMPFMAPSFLYFVEDNWRVHALITREFREVRVRARDELTVVFK